MNREAKELFLRFTKSPTATWPGNFHDFNVAVVRMATLALNGRIDVKTVNEEIQRLKSLWSTPPGHGSTDLEVLLGSEQVARIDPFDRAQLHEVIRTCQTASNLSEAGRQLFAVSRTKKKSRNEADRLRRYLSQFELSWDDISG